MIELEIFLKIGSPVQSNSSLLIFAAEHASLSVQPHQRLYVGGRAVSITRRATHHPHPATGLILRLVQDTKLGGDS